MRCETYKQLYDTVAARTSNSSGVVVIDGTSGSGKSTVTMNLARDLNGIRVSADNYVDAGRDGPFVNLLSLEFVGDDMRRLQEHFRLVMFEGICAQDVLRNIGISPLMSIYIKTISSNGLWHFEFHLENFVDGGKDRSEPIRSDYEYHARVRPHEIADVTYVRVAIK